jgi:hypothetical protein
MTRSRCLADESASGLRVPRTAGSYYPRLGTSGIRKCVVGKMELSEGSLHGFNVAVIIRELGAVNGKCGGNVLAGSGGEGMGREWHVRESGGHLEIN